MPSRPFAIHITWTCYGTWLPGDSRGHVSNTLLPDGGFEPKMNVPGTPCAEGNAFTHDRARAAQKYPTVWLTPVEARCVAGTLVGACQKRGWRILQAAVMCNHVHVVITDCPDDGPAVRRILKGTTQAALSKLLGHARRWWTEDGSNRYKHDHAAIEAAIRYVAKQAGMLAGIADMKVFTVEEGNEPPTAM
jgi:REP element-mobilizing transposase RayT